ncbi:hypothetical protein VHARVF571_180202 [Vibrio harveyi]|nr:hypothetical protein VHARVF571_180202 [Vibrio harveyi]
MSSNRIVLLLTILDTKARPAEVLTLYVKQFKKLIQGEVYERLNLNT